MARFAFVHGAWHGGWCWERVTAELERRGHETWAPDLPCEQVGLTVHDYAAAVGPQPGGVVVGHSLGGLTIPFVEAAVTVFVAAIVPFGRETYAGLSPSFTGAERDSLDRSYWPDAAVTHAKLYPELDEAEAVWAFERLRPQAWLGPAEGLPAGSWTSIVCSRDRAIRPAWQRRMAREVLGVEPIELDAGHSPFLTHPAELATILESLA
jgi:pimeloyl-ACP methyl ester carboxylesterase